MANEKLDVTVLMMCFNEEESLPQVMVEIHAALKGKKYSYEVLVVDDGSTDKTASIAQGLSCRLVRQPFHMGAGAAFKKGVLSAQGAIIVMLDADGTYTPADIPAMLEFFPEFDQVNGARTSEQGDLPLLRAPIKWLVRKFVCLLANKNIPDLQTGLKAFKRDIMLAYLWIIPDKFSHCVLITLAFLCNGYQVKYIPSEYHKRTGGRSKFHPVVDTIYVLMKVCQFFVYFDPLRIFIPVSFLLVIMGILTLLFTFDAFGIGLILILSGIIVGLQGLLADLIAAQGRAKMFNQRYL